MLKHISKEETLQKFNEFCQKHPIGLPEAIVNHYNETVIEELINEGKIIKYTHVAGIFYTITNIL